MTKTLFILRLLKSSFWPHAYLALGAVFGGLLGKWGPRVPVPAILCQEPWGINTDIFIRSQVTAWLPSPPASSLWQFTTITCNPWVPLPVLAPAEVLSILGNHSSPHWSLHGPPVSLVGKLLFGEVYSPIHGYSVGGNLGSLVASPAEPILGFSPG